ncbi:hypothetical protein LX97_02887 [Nonlabens dokdonensis]|jgi:hypothetical protein|uniref:ParB/Sulfiredoxin domain-containing protein n=2 Tax=Nonlabens dokdonensis TaxID=328515 RepID=L7WH87_NONDD|nr:hypothetical protein [Nonlabens dokdonensis]AGC78323.1 hypothetical protein DDD_3196 [Nonlabens dokdonensis DSW-6]PZX37792.1 hypothetical protein LX97_02887 [Nonlabens dokdonensis]
MSDFPGIGRKRPQLNVSYKNLFLDTNNPRLPSKIQGKSEADLIKYIKKAYYLEELAQSMSVNGYLDEEPLVAIPNKLPKKFEAIAENELKHNQDYLNFITNDTTTFTVVEGNRRLSTVKLLLSGGFQNYTSSSQAIREDLEILPVIIYPNKDSVLTYLGVRHINPVRKWGAYEKARYIAQMIEQHGISIDEVQKRIGDTSNSARKTYTSYRLIEIMEDEYSYDSQDSKENFSFLMLATGQGSIKRYIGLPEKWNDIDPNKIITKENLKKLKRVFRWIYGDGDKLSVITESRDITNKLSPVLNFEEATKYLEEYNDLEGAYDRSDGDDLLLNKYFANAIKYLDKAFLLIVDNGITDEGRVYFSKIRKRIKSIKNSLRNED